MTEESRAGQIGISHLPHVGAICALCADKQDGTIEPTTITRKMGGGMDRVEVWFRESDLKALGVLVVRGKVANFDDLEGRFAVSERVQNALRNIIKGGLHPDVQHIISAIWP